MKIEELKNLLENAKLNSKKDHFIANCPICGDDRGHFYIHIGYNSKGILHGWDCKKCGENGDIYSFLKQVDRLDLYEFGESIGEKIDFSLNEGLSVEESLIIEEADLKLPNILLPKNFKRINFSSYLKTRGFIEQDYKKYVIGTSTQYNLIDYVVFCIFEDKQLKAWVARCTKDKDYIKKHKLLRYINSEGMRSSCLMFGFEEITENTKTVICVEGIMDKNSVDHSLNLNDSEAVKCVATFGKKISDIQIYKLKQRGVKNIILVYDIDAIKEMKKYGWKLEKHFDNVRVNFTFNKDLNDSAEEEVIQVFENVYEMNMFENKFVGFNLR